jgi:hypothetical protein
MMVDGSGIIASVLRGPDQIWRPPPSNDSLAANTAQQSLSIPHHFACLLLAKNGEHRKQIGEEADTETYRIPREQVWVVKLSGHYSAADRTDYRGEVGDGRVPGRSSKCSVGHPSNHNPKDEGPNFREFHQQASFQTITRLVGRDKSQG